jgi:hypothetical protein
MALSYFCQQFTLPLYTDPNRDMFHPHGAADYLTTVLPQFFKVHTYYN